MQSLTRNEPIDRAQVSRAVGSLAWGQRRWQKDAEIRAAYELAEVEQQFQIEITGTLGAEPDWKETWLAFAEGMYPELSERDNPFTVPQHYFGTFLGSGPPAIVSAHVGEWKVQEDGAVVGAKVVIGVYEPTATGEERIMGHLAVTFQGYGAPLDTEEGEEADEV